jgi:hypothetical protein
MGVLDMKIQDIKEIGFYQMSNNSQIVYEVLQNTDNEWLKETPADDLIIDEWSFYSLEGSGCKVYQTSGGLFSRYYDLAKIEVEKITDKTFEIFGNMGAFLRVKEQQNDSN